MNIKSVTLFMVALFMFAPTGFGAPMPLTSSSIFISGTNGVFHSPLGFSLNAGNTDWTLAAKPRNNRFIKTIYRAPNDPEALLTVRADKINHPANVAQYAKKWLSDYPRFGFQVLEAKRVKVSGQLGYMIDLVSHESSKQLRQVLFVKGDVAITLTCRDSIRRFGHTLKSCDKIIRTFRW